MKIFDKQPVFYSSFFSAVTSPRRKLHPRATWFFILAALVSERSFDFPIAPATIRLVELRWRTIGPRYLRLYLPFLGDSSLIRENSSRSRDLSKLKVRGITTNRNAEKCTESTKFRCFPLMIEIKKMRRVINGSKSRNSLQVDRGKL